MTSSNCVKHVAFLTVALSGIAHSFVTRDRPFESTAPMVSNYTPSGFIANYNYSFCAADTKPIYVPPVVAYYPSSTHDVWNITGDFYNISWINPAIKTEGDGPDNVIGATRHQQGDPFATIEILSAYYARDAPNNQGFFGQMSNYAPNTVEVAPGWTTEKIRPVLSLVPACDAKAAQLGFYLTYCMKSNVTAQTAGFNVTAASMKFSAAAVNGSTNALMNVWRLLGGNKGAAFNSTGRCDAVGNYQNIKW